MLKLYNEYKDKIIAIGECGLDYDRFHYSPKDVQLKYYEPHFALAEKTGLPMYLHSRNTGDDFYSKDLINKKLQRKTDTDSVMVLCIHLQRMRMF